MITLIIFIVILGLLIFVHELGHFVMAKRAGMKVEEFGFGFPPKMFSIKKGETTYSINWIPLGGFVRILGENGEEAKDPRSFGSKLFAQKIVVLLAGVTMNFIFAWLILSIVLGLGFPTALSEGESIPKGAKIKGPTSVSIYEVASGSPAEQAGVKIGDSFYKINDVVINSIDEVQTLTSTNAGKETTFLFKRGDQLVEKKLVPRANPPQGEGSLGVALASVAKVAYPWYEVVPKGFVAALNIAESTLQAFGDIIGKLFTGQKVGAVLSGPVGIAVLTGDVAALGFVYLMQFTAVLSINLAIINVMPFPALDGGRVLFLIIEKLRGKKLPEKAEQIANTAGFALLMLLMVFITVKDVSRFNIIDKVKNLF